MKNLLYGALFLALVGMVFAGCDKLSEQLESSTKSLKIDQQDLFPFDFPDNTIVEIVDNTIYFDLPEGYSIIGITEEMTFFQSVSGASGTITCTCLVESGGCSPTKSGDTYACVMSTCSNCEKSGTVSEIAQQFSEIIIINPDKQGFYKLASNLNSKIVLPPEFLNYKLFNEPLKKLNDQMSNSNDGRRKIVFYELYGYIVPLDISFDEDTYSAYVSNDYNNSGVDCKCNDQCSDCPKEVIPLTAVYCDASNCKSCTMSATIYSPQSGEENIIEIFNHRISIK